MELWNIDINKFHNWRSLLHDFMLLYIRQSISCWNIEIFQFQSKFLVSRIFLKWRYSILNGGLFYTKLQNIAATTAFSVPCWKVQISNALCPYPLRRMRKRAWYHMVIVPRSIPEIDCLFIVLFINKITTPGLICKIYFTTNECIWLQHIYGFVNMQLFLTHGRSQRTGNFLEIDQV